MSWEARGVEGRSSIGGKSITGSVASSAEVCSIEEKFTCSEAGEVSCSKGIDSVTCSAKGRSGYSLVICSAVVCSGCSPTVCFIICFVMGCSGCFVREGVWIIAVWIGGEGILLKKLAWRRYSLSESSISTTTEGVGITEGMVGCTWVVGWIGFGVCMEVGCIKLGVCIRVWVWELEPWECKILSLLMVKWPSLSRLGAGFEESWGTEEFFCLVTGLDLFLLVMRGATSYSSSSETGEGRDSLSLFPFPLTPCLAYSGDLELLFWALELFFLCATSSRF